MLDLKRDCYGNNMNVCMIGPALSQRGGIVSVMQGLCNFLERKGIGVEVIESTSGKRFLFRFCDFLKAWALLVWGCSSRKFDVVHLHMASRGSCIRKTILALSCWALRTPYVIHLHGGEFHIFFDKEIGSVGRSFIRFAFFKAGHVIALSDYWKKWIKENIGINVRVSIIFNGVPPIDRNEDNAVAPTVLFLGKLTKGKGVGELIEAMKDVSICLPSAVLELAGDGEIEFYKEQASGLANVRFLGWISEPERLAALSRATVLCLPSWNEGLPMSILEAMSAGLPVISTPVGGIPAAVEHEVTGLLVEPGNAKALAAAICKILMNPASARLMGKEGQARHRQSFSTEAMGASCLEVYNSCLFN